MFSGQEIFFVCHSSFLHFPFRGLHCKTWSSLDAPSIKFWSCLISLPLTHPVHDSCIVPRFHTQAALLATPYVHLHYSPSWNFNSQMPSWPQAEIGELITGVCTGVDVFVLGWKKFLTEQGNCVECEAEAGRNHRRPRWTILLFVVITMWTHLRQQ